ncbi:hypothetical protein BU23DRAFT_213411 [Bimuria novae-zelandiae CBS 107.79]|uniref:Uncharacterized protein n=1 Tax=Bimuria novae-zelandiae CBS 107.79 TaxID=1447943 RepID=A0A6A5VAD9_9PLEO|nr:hypothetical protein BU23DRAFT_213411 [Bimuria novae-zelandiae CBS 107.79]
MRRSLYRLLSGAAKRYIHHCALGCRPMRLPRPLTQRLLIFKLEMHMREWLLSLLVLDTYR